MQNLMQNLVPKPCAKVFSGAGAGSGVSGAGAGSSICEPEIRMFNAILIFSPLFFFVFSWARLGRGRGVPRPPG